MVGRSIVNISDLGGILTEARRAKVSIVLVWPSRMQLWPASQEMPCRHLATEFEDKSSEKSSPTYGTHHNNATITENRQ